VRNEELTDADYAPGPSKSRTRLTAGWVLGIAVFLCVFLTAIPAIQKAREAANRAQTANNLRLIGQAMQQYLSIHGSFPPASVYGHDGKPLYSWRVLLLPYLKQEKLYEQFRLDEPWDSPHNIRLLSQMPRVYRHPGDPAGESSHTVYQAIVGKGAAFEGSRGLERRDFTDGISRTILVAEAAQAVPWSKPADLIYSPDGPLPRFGERSSDGFSALFADGSYQMIPRETREPILRALLTRNGGESFRPGI
jgi:hypothetical protein